MPICILFLQMDHPKSRRISRLLGQRRLQRIAHDITFKVDQTQIRREKKTVPGTVFSISVLAIGYKRHFLNRVPLPSITRHFRCVYFMFGNVCYDGSL